MSSRALPCLCLERLHSIRCEAHCWSRKLVAESAFGLYACSMDILHLHVGTCRCTLAGRRQPSSRQHPRTRVCSCKRRGFYPYHLCKGRDNGACHTWQNRAPCECG